MADIQLMIQSTPNPNALKFVLDKPVKSEGNITYRGVESAEDNPLACAIFQSNANIKEVYFFDNYITVTQSGDADWDELEDTIRKVILEKFESHNPDFSITVEPKESLLVTGDKEDLEKIEAILEQTIRPALQMDGGDVRVVGYDNNVVKIFYQGACGSCPSASMGTLYAIENILKEQFHPEVTVVLAE